MKRIDNLDWMRALAIIMVLIHHAAQWVPGKPQWLSALTGQGAHGVGLFFGLSGFLIGSLFFYEWKNNGHVEIKHFYLRRLTRTLPPYYIMLIVAYGAVWYMRGEPFDWGYLIFAQNYYEKVPFFLVSWSLAVEEHFYLILPVLLTLLFRLVPSKKTRLTAILGFSFIPLIFRSVDPMIGDPFGYSSTATHRNFDFMAFGVTGAYLYHYFPQLLPAVKKWMLPLIIAVFTFLLILPWWPSALEVSLGKFGLALGFSAICTVSTHSKDLPGASHWLTKMIARTSYATYLTHALVLHVIVLFQKHVIGLPSLVSFSVMMAASIIAGWAFYEVFERPIMRWRDRATRRSKETKPSTE